MASIAIRLEGGKPPVNFNVDQRRSVEHAGEPLLVLARPGTSKPGVLVARIAHLHIRWGRGE